ncbi:primary-amine oxidase [Pseudoclavibacter chungangensis]|nr:primary-amine oxidase [Pseudoclavibacter chungangensis]
MSTITEPTHPLDMLTADEIARGRAILAREGRITEHTLFPNVLLVEPDKDAVRAFRPGDALDRKILFVSLERDTGVSTETVVSLADDAIERTTTVPSGEFPYGQPPYAWEEFDAVERLVKASPEWQAAMRRRGLEDRMEHAFCGPLAPGYFGYEDEIGRRMVRSLTFLRESPGDVAWSHPVEGLLVTLDLTSGKVVSIFDEGDVATAEISGRYDTEAVGPARTDLKPIEITQPEGPSFSVDGGEVSWQGWRFRVGFSSREGLVLNQVTYRDGDEDRPVLYRASIPEMVVPYGDNSRNRYWISYFDAGEYNLGKNANSLALGCDCLGVIHYFDGVVADDFGNPMPIPQVVCMHEEDFGVLWKHTELGYRPDVRRQRRLVVSYFATVGNYDYGFYWYFYLDGSIEVEAKATGIVFNGSGVPGAEERHRLEIAPGLFAPVHQHLFCARLDVEVDGPDNYVDEVDVVRIPMGEENPYGNAFTWSRTRLEHEGGRDGNGAAGRTWHIGSKTRTNAVGKPTEFQLIGQDLPVLMADPGSSVYQRAGFATKHTWVSKFEPGEYWPAGDYPNQHAGGAGLPAYTADGDDVDGGDIVVWHTFGPTHLPRPEDFPIMPVDVYRFHLKPYGFFDRNPALDVPDWSAPAEGGSCCSHEGHGATGLPVYGKD